MVQLKVCVLMESPRCIILNRINVFKFQPLGMNINNGVFQIKRFNKNFFIEKSHMVILLAHSSSFREKLHYGKSASLTKSWTQLQSFRFPFHLTAYSREKSGSVQTSFQISNFKVKSALNPAY